VPLHAANEGLTLPGFLLLTSFVFFLKTSSNLSLHILFILPTPLRTYKRQAITNS